MFDPCITHQFETPADFVCRGFCFARRISRVDLKAEAASEPLQCCLCSDAASHVAAMALSHLLAVDASPP